jgi:hypothetical protein
MKPNLTGNRLIALFLALSGLLFLVTPVIRAQAQENIADVTPQDNGEMVPSADDSQDPPSRVARLSYMDGSVFMLPGGAVDWGQGFTRGTSGRAGLHSSRQHDCSLFS